jgi:hypothetical protein
MSTTANSPPVRQLTVADLTAIVELQEAVTAEPPVGDREAWTRKRLFEAFEPAGVFVAIAEIRSGR